MRSIAGVLFDVGGVLIRTPFEMLATHPTIDVAWRGPFEPGSDHLFADVAEGTMTEREYWQHRAGELAGHLELADPADAMRHVFSAPEAEVVRSEVIALVTELDAAGFKTGILTNDLAKFHGGRWWDDLPSLAGFTFHVDLSHTETLKPHPEAYRLGTDEMGLAPHEVLFVDDQPVNIVP